MWFFAFYRPIPQTSDTTRLSDEPRVMKNILNVWVLIQRLQQRQQLRPFPVLLLLHVHIALFRGGGRGRIIGVLGVGSVVAGINDDTAIDSRYRWLHSTQHTSPVQPPPFDIDGRTVHIISPTRTHRYRWPHSTAPIQPPNDYMPTHPSNHPLTTHPPTLGTYENSTSPGAHPLSCSPLHT